MKLEYLPNDASGDTPLVRLYDFDIEVVSLLRGVFTRLATGSTRLVDLHDLAFIDPIGGCQLTLMVDRFDKGLFEIAGPAYLQCVLTADGWDRIEGLTQPFTCLDSQGFQWLETTEIPLLLSTDGDW